MKKYMVYFKIGDKRLKMEVAAKDEEGAKNMVKAKIHFNKIEEVPLTKDETDFLNELKDIFSKL